MIPLILFVAALILFLLAGVGVSSGRFNLVALGLACWAAGHLIMSM